MGFAYLIYASWISTNLFLLASQRSFKGSGTVSEPMTNAQGFSVLGVWILILGVFAYAIWRDKQKELRRKNEHERQWGHGYARLFKDNEQINDGSWLTRTSAKIKADERGNQDTSKTTSAHEPSRFFEVANICQESALATRKCLLCSSLASHFSQPFTTPVVEFYWPQTALAQQNRIRKIITNAETRRKASRGIGMQITNFFGLGQHKEITPKIAEQIDGAMRYILHAQKMNTSQFKEEIKTYMKWVNAQKDEHANVRERCAEELEHMNYNYMRYMVLNCFVLNNTLTLPIRMDAYSLDCYMRDTKEEILTFAARKNA